MTSRAVDTPTPPDPGLTVERLTTVLYDWMPDGADLSDPENDGQGLHLTGGDLARFIFDRASDYAFDIEVAATPDPSIPERPAEPPEDAAALVRAIQSDWRFQTFPDTRPVGQEADAAIQTCVTILDRIAESAQQSTPESRPHDLTSLPDGWRWGDPIPEDPTVR